MEEVSTDALEGVYWGHSWRGRCTWLGGCHALQWLHVFRKAVMAGVMPDQKTVFSARVVMEVTPFILSERGWYDYAILVEDYAIDCV